MTLGELLGLLEGHDKPLLEINVDLKYSAAKDATAIGLRVSLTNPDLGPCFLVTVVEGGAGSAYHKLAPAVMMVARKVAKVATVASHTLGFSPSVAALLAGRSKTLGERIDSDVAKARDGLECRITKSGTRWGLSLGYSYADLDLHLTEALMQWAPPTNFDPYGD